MLLGPGTLEKERRVVITGFTWPRYLTERQEGNKQFVLVGPGTLKHKRREVIRLG